MIEFIGWLDDVGGMLEESCGGLRIVALKTKKGLLWPEHNENGWRIDTVNLRMLLSADCREIISRWVQGRTLRKKGID